jgi:hemolysin III
MFIIHAPRWITAGVYLVMGWLSIVGVNEIITRMPTGAILWLIAGGMFYTVGAFIYMTKKFNFIPGVIGFHEIWHIFVILGALSHFMIMLLYINP